jgi:hypothetical protein
MSTAQTVNPGTRETYVTVAFTDRDLAVLEQRIIELAASRLADQFVARHGDAVLAAITPQAVATLALARSAAGIDATIQAVAREAAAAEIRRAGAFR